MDLHTLARRFTVRSGYSWCETRRFVRLFFAEIADQLALGEEINIPKVGRLKAMTVKPRARHCNLPATGMVGKKILSAGRQEIGFTPSRSWKDFIRGEKGLRTLVLFATKPRLDNGEEKVTMAGKKRGRKKKVSQKEIVVRVPEGVESIRIDLVPPTKGTKEDVKGKRKLLG